MPRIASRKARYLPAEQDLHGSFNFEGNDEVKSYHSTAIALISDRGPDKGPVSLNFLCSTYRTL